MGKQTMGTPGLSWVHRADNKMYRIQTPQAPIVHCEKYRDYQFDTYPQGMNSVVAVISYTGCVRQPPLTGRYDLEDAMILNKSSFERGFAHASVYKTVCVDLVDERNKATSTRIFKRPKKEDISPKVCRLALASPLGCLRTASGRGRLAAHRAVRGAGRHRVLGDGQRDGQGELPQARVL